MLFAFEIEREFDKILGIDEFQKKGKKNKQKKIGMLDSEQCLLNQVQAAQLSE